MAYLLLQTVTATKENSVKIIGLILQIEQHYACAVKEHLSS